MNCAEKAGPAQTLREFSHSVKMQITFAEYNLSLSLSLSLSLPRSASVECRHARLRCPDPHSMFQSPPPRGPWKQALGYVGRRNPHSAPGGEEMAAVQGRINTPKKRRERLITLMETQINREDVNYRGARRPL